jgi:hemerythrin
MVIPGGSVGRGIIGNRAARPGAAWSYAVRGASRAKIENGEKIALELLHFLTDWLAKHIQVSDRDYSNFIAERQRPKSIFARFFGAMRPQAARG